MVNIEIDGKKIEADDGAMVIEAADEAGIYIPRFCYHKKLSVAANCRMCLVEVEKARKPLPACATPVTEGMRIFTKSPAALAAQKGVMEFLLINHPLDCPICDQGGECELQDVAMGYGGDVSRYAENKRVVPSKNLGPLIATDMTRCIHCTRCVRFGEEVAGLKELGATGRGEHMQIGTYVERTVDSELSGNVIDLCPVGALTSKPFRYRARSWEMMERDTVAAHDCVGSNVSAHVRGREIMRVVPQDNEGINETWISDRDRYSYEGVNSDQRLLKPLLRKDSGWQEVSWDEALNAAVAKLKAVVDGHGADQLGFLASPNATLEEHYLFQKLARAVGSSNMDHRLRQQDFSDQDFAPLYPGLGQSIAALEKLEAALLIGSNVRKEQPILGHRLRKAAMNGAQISFINSIDYEYRFDIANKIIATPVGMVKGLAEVVKALADMGAAVPSEVAGVLADVEVGEAARNMAASLKDKSAATILLGTQAMAHPQFATLRALALAAAQMSGARLGYLPDGANSAGASLVGCLPHRAGNGAPAERKGLSATAMLNAKLKGFVLMGVEPEFDCIDGATAQAAMAAAEGVVALTSYVSENMLRYADVLLPVAPTSESAGTFVNAEGCWQSFEAVSLPRGEARPAWKVLRVLGNLLDLEDFDYVDIQQLHDAARAVAGEGKVEMMSELRAPEFLGVEAAGLVRIADVPIYAVDGSVRRATSLQQTHDAIAAAAYMSSGEMAKRGCEEGAAVIIKQDGVEVRLNAVVDERVPAGCVYVPAAVEGATNLGAPGAAVELSRA